MDDSSSASTPAAQEASSSGVTDSEPALTKHKKHYRRRNAETPSHPGGSCCPTYPCIAHTHRSHHLHLPSPIFNTMQASIAPCSVSSRSGQGGTSLACTTLPALARETDPHIVTIDRHHPPPRHRGATGPPPPLRVVTMSARMTAGPAAMTTGTAAAAEAAAEAGEMAAAAAVTDHPVMTVTEVSAAPGMNRAAERHRHCTAAAVDLLLRPGTNQLVSLAVACQLSTHTCFALPAAGLPPLEVALRRWKRHRRGKSGQKVALRTTATGRSPRHCRQLLMESHRCVPPA